MTVALESIESARDKIRSLSCRSRGRNLEQVTNELNAFLRGWLNYYPLAESKRFSSKLDSWIRRSEILQAEAKKVRFVHSCFVDESWDKGKVGGGCREVNSSSSVR